MGRRAVSGKGHRQRCARENDGPVCITLSTAVCNQLVLKRGKGVKQGDTLPVVENIVSIQFSTCRTGRIMSSTLWCPRFCLVEYLLSSILSKYCFTVFSSNNDNDTA